MPSPSEDNQVKTLYETHEWYDNWYRLPLCHDGMDY